MNSQNFEKENQSEFVLNESLLSTNINTYRNLFKSLPISEAHTKGISTMYNYICIKENIFYNGNKVYNLVLKVNNDKILRVHFEIEYSSKSTLYYFIDKLGYPESGRSSPNVEIYKNLNEDKLDKSNLLYENFNALYWKADENYFDISISNITNLQFFSLNNPRLWIDFSIAQKFLKYEKIQNSKAEDSITSVLFEKQLETFKKLGYFFNKDLTKQKIIRTMMSDGLIDYPIEFVDTHSESKLNDYFEELPFTRLYYFYGWTTWNLKDSALKPFTNHCIWYDVKFLRYNVDYIELMQRIGNISRGELNFSEIKIVNNDTEKKEIRFTVNGIQKTWIINTNDLFNTYIKRFSNLTNELKTSRQFTFFTSDSEQFVLDYSTEKEQMDFIKLTHLDRKWLKNVTL